MKRKDSFLITSMSQLLNKEYSKEILSSLIKRPMRFTEVMESLGGRPSKSTLSKRLDQLCRANLLVKVPDSSLEYFNFTLSDIGRRVAEEVQKFTKNVQGLAPAIIS